MSSLVPEVASIGQNSGKRKFLLQEDYIVDCCGFADAWISQLQLVFQEEGRKPWGGNRRRKPPTSSADFKRILGGSGNLTVPKGFEFDGASIPRIAELIGPILGFSYRQGDFRLHSASVVHDWIYFTHQMPKANADDLFYYMLRQSEVGWSNAWMMWSAVRNHGKSSWKNSSKDKIYLKRLCKKVFEKNERIEQYSFPRKTVEKCCPSARETDST